MNPEELISAFLSVWENKPELFKNPEVSDSLGDLQNQLIKLKTASDEQIAECLESWFSNYEAITDAVDAASTRKIRGEHNIPPSTESHDLVNLYPEITEVLRTRLPRMGKKEGKS
jgi:hypothetical protein